ncbi:hypothetical protein [Bradyrhizobium ivorense]|uniref:hypothetical protein n=1 Tax=Bradyrhizobium ivorense TaxID=2511166 RepID=UPI0010AF8499|nr:hypothetical protein [Bradyrhizobium ivorense]VIO67209.1 hypothetical protein CI41S_05710 [Bradyrhizobium ivorense]
MRRVSVERVALIHQDHLNGHNPEIAGSRRMPDNAGTFGAAPYRTEVETIAFVRIRQERVDE